MAEIARLEPVGLREVWPSEASDFTPWLAENLDALGEVLGMKLEFIEREAPVGPFSLDIRARDADDDRTVVIENQLTRTDHDHLGKALTYAAGFNADVMVWIVREFQDEHRQALDWLNQRTGEETEFYGVVVRAVRIGSSPPAPVFDVVARPNTFVKIRKSSVDGGQLSTTQQMYFAFWPKVLDRLRDDHKLTFKRNSTTKSWMDFASGIHGVRRNVSFSSQDARVELYLDTGDESRNKRLFDLLHNQRARLEEAFGEGFTWERLDNKKASRIALYLPNKSIRDSEETLNDTVNWMVNKYVKLVETVVPIVGEAAREVDSSMGQPSTGEDSGDQGEEENGN